MREEGLQELRELQTAHAKELQQLRNALEAEKQAAVSQALQMTLGELRSALEQAHQERDNAVRIVREEWQLRLKDVVGKARAEAQDDAIKAAKAAAAELAECRSRLQLEAEELRNEIGNKVDRIAELSGLLNDEREERQKLLSKMAEQRKRAKSFENMSQLYEVQSSSSPGGKEVGNSGGGWLSSFFRRPSSASPSADVRKN